MSRSVLVVDDTTFIRKVMRDILESNGYNVVGEAINGKQALEMYQQHAPALVIMDIAMPEMDGFEAVEQIKKIDNNAKIIMCSVMGYKEAVTRCIEAGASDYIVKPIKTERVLAAVEKAFSV
ncbi:response regulator [Desulfuribacillus alkaliarsenatis]|uniref:Two-component system response regulator n=1 Tax=Desulfuribacillus alkaliarsenatis TaxID=766136 RepID=A0A1E5FZ94_9FIRM|nr:response regulator [Desulfuribacillus alkaliarsenatis]OEF95893.1 two-component system response regulator [Desulfuribacillus alkaliarsenatis]